MWRVRRKDHQTLSFSLSLSWSNRKSGGVAHTYGERTGQQQGTLKSETGRGHFNASTKESRLLSS